MHEDSDPDVESTDYRDRLVDEVALQRFLETELGSAASYHLDILAEGNSNETFVVTWGDREFVLRRPPAGETADSAHDVLREYRIMDALQNTAVPVPPTVVACEDTSVIGSEFYLMGRVAGNVVHQQELDRFATPAHRSQVAEQLVDTLAKIHAVDHEQIGLDAVGHPEGFLDRQVERWRSQLAWATDRTAAVRPLPDVHEVGEWLASSVPETTDHTIVHGDYKLDNVVLAPGTPPEVVSVLDWEMGTVGDPLKDVGWLLCFWTEDLADVEVIPSFLNKPGYPSRRDLLARYERVSDVDVHDVKFHYVLGLYMLTAVLEMFFRRYLEGNADDPIYPKMETTVPRVGEYALSTVEDGGANWGDV